VDILYITKYIITNKKKEVIYENFEKNLDYVGETLRMETKPSREG
jgi:hypothetical protein